jgi:Iron-containing redox enzyme
MLTATISMQWLWEISQKYRDSLRNNSFYKSVSLAASSNDLQWIRQLYYLSCDFTAATAIRYGKCDDPLFRDSFAEHAAEEVEHPQQLAAWMREFGLLAPKEEPTSVPPTLETLALGSYFIRSVIREPIAHQIITLNLMTESIATDFYTQVNPKLAELGLTPKGYWLVHQEADVKHQLLGLDLIPQCEKNSLTGRRYIRTAWEVASLWEQLLNSWNSIDVA